MHLSSPPDAQTSGAKKPDTEAMVSLHERVIASHDLFRGAREVMIVHQQARYRLQITSQGKLILTK